MRAASELFHCRPSIPARALAPFASRIEDAARSDPSNCCAAAPIDLQEVDLSQPIAGFEARVSSGYYDDSNGECRSSSESNAATLVDGPPTLSDESPLAAARFRERAEGIEASSAVEDLILACQRLTAAAPQPPLPPHAPTPASCTEPIVGAVSSCLAVVGRVIVGAPSVAGALVALAGGIACGLEIAKAHECLEKPKP